MMAAIVSPGDPHQLSRLLSAWDGCGCRYEGASTIFGPHTLDAYIQVRARARTHAGRHERMRRLARRRAWARVRGHGGLTDGRDACVPQCMGAYTACMGLWGDGRCSCTR